jgi:hypothetical protein
VLSLLSAYPDVMHVETDHAAALPEALADFARKGIDLLVVNGGDGTLQHALTEILAGDDFERIPMIAPLRGGRTNMTALDLGAQRDPVKGLASVLEAVRTRRLSERMVRRPVLRVAYHRGFAVQYGMFFGAGMIHRAIALHHRLFPKGRVRDHGVLGPGLVTAGLIGKTMLRPRNGVLAPDKVQMLLDGESVPQGEFRLVIASSLNRLFLRGQRVPALPQGRAGDPARPAQAARQHGQRLYQQERAARRAALRLRVHGGRRAVRAAAG